ncbi:alpha/beta hydrolase [Flagellimonas algicola]|uniref:Alpha/beta hydrolase n=1 Tax=Flagellimonas algicola TaxID=2583815 RepID=A0ABY2WQ04_9FLAO|nr:alpha/beta hydrolase [Allomuricauda algicola]TMU56619.1 alpha/beta hydrolase [Allomuricauda algicola]
MRTWSITVIGALLLMGSCRKEVKQETVTEPELSREISFYTPDSIQIFGDLYELDKHGKTILLFHQGGSNARGEYEPIIPTLIQKGYNILAIDQRVGGQFYGNYNRTLANIPTNGFGDGYGYCDAYNNLESALDFIIDSGFTGDKIVWGSSYSASLGIHLANNRQQDIRAVLAFSPASGNSMKDCLPNAHFETIKIPLLLLRPPHEMERETSKLQSELAKTHGHKTFVPQHGVHGSSMLVASRVGSNVDETWKVVFSFLDTYQ